MASRNEAEEALYDGIVAAARSAADKQDASVLKTAAEAFREVAHGPQGGSYDAFHINRNDTTTTTHSSSRSSHTSDYHETHHPDAEPRQRTGFAPDESIFPMPKMDYPLRHGKQAVENGRSR